MRQSTYSRRHALRALVLLLPCIMLAQGEANDKPQPKQGHDIKMKELHDGLRNSGVMENGKRKLKILINNPATTWSHLQFQGRLADILAEAGHEVHLLIQVSNPNLANYTGTTRGQRILRATRAPGKENDFLRSSIFADYFDGPPSMFQMYAKLRSWRRAHLEICEDLLLANHELVADLKREHYDVGLSEFYHACTFGLFKHIGVHTSLASLAVGFNSFTGGHFGIPTFPSWQVSFNVPSAGGPKMSFWERAFTLYAHVLNMQTMRENYAAHERIFERAFGGDFPSPGELMRNVSLLFVNSNEFFDLPLMISNKIVNIGGIVEKQTSNTSLPARFAPIFENSQSGVVLFSMGTTVDAGMMPERMKRAFLNAFARFPNYEFIWKYKVQEEKSDLIGDVPPNVHLFEWVEQKAMLQHPRLRAFITHCGLNSLNEAARAGVPVVCLPLFVDQHYNAAIANWKRVGVSIWDVRACEDERTIIDALRAVLKDPIYAHNARLVSRKLRLSPFSPAERFVRWVEFAADYPELNELNLPYHEFSFLTYYCLDVIAFTLVGLAAALLAALWAIRCLVHRIMAVTRMGTKKTKRA